MRTDGSFSKVSRASMRYIARSLPESPQSFSRRCSCALKALYVISLCSLACHSSQIRKGPAWRRTASHSSHALPAPKPNPTNAGHALRLNKSTEKMTPNDAPSVERMSIVLRQWSHCHVKRLANATATSVGIAAPIDLRMVLAR